MAFGKGRPYIDVPETQLKQLCALLDEHKIRYEVDDDLLSVDGKPWTALVTLARDADPDQVQRILDGIP
jgi:hypothetical protein